MIGWILFFAALPPLAQETKEIKAILDDARLDNALQSQLIQRIEKVENGYLVSTASKQLLIKVNYLPQATPGPAKFELRFP